MSASSANACASAVSGQRPPRHRLLSTRCLGLALFAVLSAGVAGAASDHLASDKVHPSLAAHSAEFEQRIYTVTEGVYVAVGYALGNSILLEGEDGVVIVDVTESVETARAIWTDFRKITDKPIRALVYTHNHGDHVFGGRGFVPNDSTATAETGAVDVIAHSTTNDYINRVINIIRPAISARSTRMFGHLLPESEEGFVNAGIGPFLAVGAHGRGGTIGLIRPTLTFDQRLEIEIAGIRLELVHAPGETNDQIFIWLPDKKVLLPGDNIYKAFPNLYTIRGTLYRDVRAWTKSLDQMRALEPAHVVPSHTRPFSGPDNVREILTAYRDAIQFVHDQTIRGLNRGLTPGELVETVRLPEHLERHPYLQEHYGSVAWSVRNIFNGYLGWFDGDAANLSPVAPAERAQSLVELAGGRDRVLEAVEQAAAAGGHAWAAELVSHLLLLEPDNLQLRDLKAGSLRQLGYASVSPNGRHYYLTQALELEGKTDPAGLIDLADPELIKTFPIENILASLAVNLDPVKSAETHTVAGFRFTDTGEEFTVHVRRGVAELQPKYPDNPDLEVEASTGDWIEVLLGMTDLPAALADGRVKLTGEPMALGGFLLLFR